MDEDLVNHRLSSIEADVKEVREILTGNGKMGMVAKLEVMWRSYIAILSLLSAGIGALATWLIQQFSQ